MSRLVPALGPIDHRRGPEEALVQLVEYGDYECPFCGQAYPIVERLLRDLGDSTLYAFRHFPLAQTHPNALLAAQAAEAAGAQGRFWDMHHALFQHQQALEPEALLGHAKALELDLPRFARELADEVHLDRVMHDFQSGVRSGVNGTPTFFIDGIRHDGRWDRASLTAAVVAAAQRKDPALDYVPT